MLYDLSLLTHTDQLAFFRLFKYLTFRSGAAVMTSILIAFLINPALIAWLKQQSPVPVWLVGTSRGTQSAAYVATEATPAQGGPDGLVLTSTILVDPKGRAVPQMPVEKLAIPVLVVHHENDGCKVCLFSDMPMLMDKLAKTPKAELIRMSGGQSRGDPCEAMAYHGFNGLEADVVGKISRWVIAAKP